MEKNIYPKKNHRDSINISPVSLKQNPSNAHNQLKKMNIFKCKKKKSKFKMDLPQKIMQNEEDSYEIVNQRDSLERDSLERDSQDTETRLVPETSLTPETSLIPETSLTPNHEPKYKGVRFRDRVSIDEGNMMLVRKNIISFDKTTSENIQMLNDIAKDKNLHLPMRSRRRENQSTKAVSELLRSGCLSKNTIANQLKCLMCHCPDQPDILFTRRLTLSVKQKLHQTNLEQQSVTFFRYDVFGQFLNSLSQLNYDSYQTVNLFQTLLSKYEYPVSVKLMLLYLGSFLYQLNNMYDRSGHILDRFFYQLMKHRIYQLTGVYLLMVVKMKANLLEWQQATQYLMKLLAFSWLFKEPDLQIWCYYQLARGYLFMGQIQQTQYYTTRSQMSITQPTTSIYRQLVAKQFKNQIQLMRQQHRPFDLTKKISICQLTKLPSTTSHYQLKDKGTFKLQSQIRHINQHCKIRHVKNLLIRMGSADHQEIRSHRNYTSDASSLASSSHNLLNKTHRHLAGNPLLRTHESGLKNLNIYFRNNNKGQSLLNKNREPKLYTFENSSKNICVLREMSRCVLLQMKYFVKVNMND